MSFGYSLRVAEAIREADANLIGVRLGRYCLQHDIPVLEVASELGVTRQTVYSWFCGEREPSKAAERAIRTYLDLPE